MSREFAHLHIHTIYSVTDGSIMLKQLAKKCKDNNMPACAITDHRAGFGFIKFYDTMKENGVKPILGYESYTKVKDKYVDLIKTKTDEKREYSGHHLILLAKNNEGYKNLLKIISWENEEGLVKKGKFAKGNLDLDWVKQNGLGKDIICLTACLGGTASKLITYGFYNESKQYVLDLKNTFEETYIEVQSNTVKDQAFANMELIRMAQETNIPLVLTKDAHYLNADDYESHDTLIAMQFNKKIDDPDRFRFPGGADYYVATPDEMYQFCLDNRIPLTAFSNTMEIANKCNVYLFDEKDESGKVIHKGFYGGSLFPDYEKLPPGFTQETYLRKLAMDGLIDFTIKAPYSEAINVQEYIDRLNYELGIICDMGYAGYFLILWDFMKFCKDYRDPMHPNGIGTGTGRGSGVGSLVCRSLNITKIDPIKYNLLFERFLNPERNSIPDVDLDVSDLDRGLVIDYLKQTYGERMVAQIVTFGHITHKSGTRNTMRLKGHTKKEQDAVCNQLPDKLSSEEIMDALSPNPSDKMADLVPIATKEPWIFTQVAKLNGCVDRTGAHAGGVIIWPEDGRNFAPHSAPSGEAICPVCQFAMKAIDKIRALKIDVLGLTTSRIISNTARDVNIDIDYIDFEDPKVYELLRNGLTVDIFQFSSPGMTKALIDAKVKCMEDIIAIIALYRPGPLDAVDKRTGKTIYQTFIDCCASGTNYSMHPRLDHILEGSRGLMIYQEDVMKVVMEMGDCSLGYADVVRRAIGKKDEELMKQIENEFLFGKRKMAIDSNTGEKVYDPNGEYILKDNGKPVIRGACNNGFTYDEAKNIWDMIFEFAKYCFNKSHATAYAVNAYQTAYEKLYYPAEFMAQCISAKDKSEDKAKSIAEAKKLGVQLLPPSINHSKADFTVEIMDDGRKGIRCGFGIISGINNTDTIVENRPYSSIDDFFAKVDGSAVNKSKATNLILAGVFDEYNSNRFDVYMHYFGDIRCDLPVSAEFLEQVKEVEKARKKDKSIKPITNEKGKIIKAGDCYVPKDPLVYNDNIRFSLELELAKMYISGHPLEQYPYKPWQHVGHNEKTEATGIIKRVTVREDRYKRPYAFFTLECLGDVRDCVMWANVYSKYGNRLEKDKTLLVRGKKDAGRDQFVINEALLKLESAKVGNDVINNQVNVTTHCKPRPNFSDTVYQTENNVQQLIYENNNNVNNNQQTNLNGMFAGQPF